MAYAGAQDSFTGLDQINLVIPASLRSAGEVKVNCTVFAQASNSFNLLFQ